jgi:alkaline phosphatase D
MRFVLPPCVLLIGACAGPDDTAPPQRAAISVGPYTTAVHATGATVVMRVERGPPMTLVAHDRESGESVRVGPVTPWGRDDWMIHFQLEGLEPSSTWDLEVHDPAGPVWSEHPRSFTTAPDPDTPTDFVIGLLADASSHDHNDSPTYQSLASQSPDLILQIGDISHCDPGADPLSTLEAWHRMYREQMATFDQGARLDEHLLSSVPFFHTWDDHDYGDDNADGTAAWKDKALTSFRDYFPLFTDAPAPANEGIWYSIRWGQTEIFMLDGRSQRSPVSELDGEDKSLLAMQPLEQTQKAWLMQALQQSDATWKLLVSGSVFNLESKHTDSWWLYQTERAELLGWIESNGITGVMVASGDIHSGGAIDDGRFANLPELSVPTTNTNVNNCTGGTCGMWSEGVHVGDSPQGFGLIRFAWDESTGSHTATLETWSARGEKRLVLELTPGDAVVDWQGPSD